MVLRRWPVRRERRRRSADRTRQRLQRDDVFRIGTHRQCVSISPGPPLALRLVQTGQLGLSDQPSPPMSGPAGRAADTVSGCSPGPRTSIAGTPPILTSSRATRPGVDVLPIPMRATADDPTTTNVGGASESGGTTTA